MLVELNYLNFFIAYVFGIFTKATVLIPNEPMKYQRILLYHFYTKHPVLLFPNSFFNSALLLFSTPFQTLEHHLVPFPKKSATIPLVGSCHIGGFRMTLILLLGAQTGFSQTSCPGSFMTNTRQYLLLQKLVLFVQKLA